jgi:hypothetical protein
MGQSYTKKSTNSTTIIHFNFLRESNRAQRFHDVMYKQGSFIYHEAKKGSISLSLIANISKDQGKYIPIASRLRTIVLGGFPRAEWLWHI